MIVGVKNLLNTFNYYTIVCTQHLKVFNFNESSWFCSNVLLISICRKFPRRNLRLSWSSLPVARRSLWCPICKLDNHDLKLSRKRIQKSFGQKKRHKSLMKTDIWKIKTRNMRSSLKKRCASHHEVRIPLVGWSIWKLKHFLLTILSGGDSQLL